MLAGRRADRNRRRRSDAVFVWTLETPRCLRHRSVRCL